MNKSIKDKFQASFEKLTKAHFEAQYNDNTDLNEVNTLLTLDEFKKLLKQSAYDADIEFNKYINGYPIIDFLTDEFLDELNTQSAEIGSEIFEKNC